MAVVIAANRTRHPLDARTLARLAAAVRRAAAWSGSGCPTTSGAGSTADFARAFAIARRAGLASVPHGGELRGADSVDACLSLLHADRLGHGVRCAEDPDVLARVVDSGVTLEVCPVSNVALGVYATLEEVPVPTLLDAGVPVALGADDPLLFGSRLAGQYAVVRAAHDLSDADAGRAGPDVGAGVVRPRRGLRADLLRAHRRLARAGVCDSGRVSDSDPGAGRPDQPQPGPAGTPPPGQGQPGYGQTPGQPGYGPPPGTASRVRPAGVRPAGARPARVRPARLPTTARYGQPGYGPPAGYGRRPGTAPRPDPWRPLPPRSPAGHHGRRAGDHRHRHPAAGGAVRLVDRRQGASVRSTPATGALGGRQNAQIGYVLGIVGTVILGLIVLLFVGFFGFFGLALLGAPTTAVTTADEHPPRSRLARP